MRRQGPVPAAAVAVLRRGRLLLIRRGAEPNRGRWALPGGAVEVGETVERAARREALEEVGLRVRLGPLVGVKDNIVREGDSVRFHYVIAVFTATAKGIPRAGSDALDVRWTAPEDAARLDLTPTTREVLAALRFSRR